MYILCFPRLKPQLMGETYRAKKLLIKSLTYISVMHLQSPVFHSTIPIYCQSLDGNLHSSSPKIIRSKIFIDFQCFQPLLKHIIKKFPSIYHVFLRFLLVISKHSRLENKIPHMDVRPSDLPPTVSRHPSLVHHLGHLCSRKKSIFNEN